MSSTNAKTTYAARIVRVFDAPRERVFEAWTDPEQIRRWWAPGQLEIVEIRGEVAAGKSLHVVMVNHENGERYTSETHYVEVDPPNRIVWNVKLDWAQDENTRVTVTFEDANPGTKVTLLHALFLDDTNRGHVETGWTASLEELNALLIEAS